MKNFASRLCAYSVSNNCVHSGKIFSEHERTYVRLLGTPEYEDLTVIDTPGFGVIANDDTFDTNYKHARSVVEYLKENTPSITTFLICIHGQYPRISNGLRLMLIQLENIFGEDFWKNVVLEFTHYGFSDEEINEKFERKLEMNRMLKGYFGFQVRPFVNIFKQCDL